MIELRRWVRTLMLCTVVAAQPVAASVETSCVGAKLEAIARKEAGLISCLANVASMGRSTHLGRCIQRTARRYVSGFAKAGQCSGDDGTCGCLAENCAVAVRLALPDTGPSRCEATRLRAAARRVVGTLRCNARAATRSVAVDQLCLNAVEARYQAAFARATGCTGDRDAVGTIVDGTCVVEVGAHPTGGAVVGDLCTSHACDGVDARER